jgi:hypothetical protein
MRMRLRLKDTKGDRLLFQKNERFSYSLSKKAPERSLDSCLKVSGNT